MFVLPSYIESFPLSLLEAMALGVPVVATDVGGIRDHLIEPGASGLLVPPKNSEVLHSAIVELVSNSRLRTNLGVNAREKVKDLTFKGMAGTTAAFYVHLKRAQDGIKPKG